MVNGLPISGLVPGEHGQGDVGQLAGPQFQKPDDVVAGEHANEVHLLEVFGALMPRKRPTSKTSTETPSAAPAATSKRPGADNMWPATQSQLYGELNKLADAGLIKVSDIGPRGREEMRSPTPDAELHRWITSPQDDPPIRNAAMLRVFLLGQLTPGQAREYLESLRSTSEQEHAHYEQILDSYEWSADDDAFFARAVLEQGCVGPSTRSTGPIG